MAAIDFFRVAAGEHGGELQGPHGAQEQRVGKDGDFDCRREQCKQDAAD